MTVVTSLHRFFRFSQTLVDLLGADDSPVKLSEKQREGIETYDRELEDFLSDFLVSTDDDGNLPVTGTDTWEVVSGDLHPVATPTTFTVSGAIDFIDIEATSASGTVNLQATNEIDITSGASTVITTGNQFSAQADGLMSLSGGLGGTGNVEIFAGGTTADVTLDANRDVRIDGNNTDQVAIAARNASPTDARINNGAIVFYLDEGTNTLKVRCRLSGGGYKTGTIAIV